MNKRRGLALTACILLLCLTVCFPCLAEGISSAESTQTVAKVTTPKGPLRFREKANSRGSVLGEIPNGTCLLLLEEGKKWSLCQWNGQTGYCATKYLTILKDADPVLVDYRVLRQDDKGEDVLALKERLQELGYIRSGSALTELYNDILTERIRLCQRQIGITEDGIASQELQAWLFSDRAQACTQTLPSVRSPVRNGENGMRRIFCGCCMGEGCECCKYTGWIYY